MRRVLALVTGTAAFWLLVALPGRWLWGDLAVVHSATAALLCLIPTALTLVATAWAFRQSPDQQLLVVLGGTGVRMFFVLTAALGLYVLVPYLRERPGFWAWLLVFYLFTLALEMVLVLTGRPVEERHGA